MSTYIATPTTGTQVGSMDRGSTRDGPPVSTVTLSKLFISWH